LYSHEILRGFELKKAIQIDRIDNVATVTGDVIAGEDVEVLSPKALVILRIKSVEKITYGHKIALKEFKKGEQIIKYGEVIGVASNSINVGQWVHTQNVESRRLPTSKMEVIK
jgi:altronate dehydratase small subunit